MRLVLILLLAVPLLAGCVDFDGAHEYTADDLHIPEDLLRGRSYRVLDPSRYFEDPDVFIYIRNDADFRYTRSFAMAFVRGCHSDEMRPSLKCQAGWAIRLVRYSSGEEWLEAHSSTCPALLKELEKLKNLPDWSYGEFGRISEDDPDVLLLRLHPFMFEINFSHQELAPGLEGLEWHGTNWEGNPGDWAVNLMYALDDCWKPSSAKPPWITR